MTVSHLSISIKATSNIAQISTNWAFFDLQKHRMDTGLFPVKAQTPTAEKHGNEKSLGVFYNLLPQAENLKNFGKKKTYLNENPPNYQVKQENPVVLWQDIKKAVGVKDFLSEQDWEELQS